MRFTKTATQNEHAVSKSYELLLIVFLGTAFAPRESASTLPPEIADSSDAESWKQWKETYHKQYASEQDEMDHFNTWCDNLEKVQMHNSMPGNTFRVGMNAFADMSQEDFAESLLGFIPSVDNSTNDNDSGYSAGVSGQVPEAQDWREKGYVTPVGSQGTCGSCWAFVTTGSLEAQYFNKTGVLPNLSEQQLVDCDVMSYGCSGGNVEFAFNYLKEAGSVEEEYYPYEGNDDGSCRDSGLPVFTGVTEYHKLPIGDEGKLKEAVGLVGPVAAAIDGSHFSFQFYTTGIYYEPSCDPMSLDHSLLIVGYGSEAGQDYWLARNSWGEDWGIQGYIKVSRNRDNHCGIASYAGYPVI